MKIRKGFVVMLFIALLLFGCKDFLVDRTKLFIPGTYIRFSQHEFGKEYDTITISLEDETAEAYKIVRSWRYERTLDGELLEPEYKVVKTMGYYQRATSHLWENGSGTIYVFDPEKFILKNGTINYKKL